MKNGSSVEVFDLPLDKNSILKNYLSQDYLFFISNNSSKLIRNISSESNLFSVGVVGNLIMILSNL